MASSSFYVLGFFFFFLGARIVTDKFEDGLTDPTGKLVVPRSVKPVGAQRGIANGMSLASGLSK